MPLSLTMRFKLKLLLLICACVLVLTGLCFIQYRLVQNTYRLEQADYLAKVKSRLAALTQTFSDSLNHQVMDKLLNHVEQELNSGKKPTLTGFQQQTDRVKEKFRKPILHALKNDSLLCHIGYHLEYTQILLYQNHCIDTLWRRDEPALILAGEEKKKQTEVFNISGGQQQAGFGLEHNKIKSGYRLAVWNSTYIDAAGWKRTILRRMTATLVGSGLLIIAVLIIFVLIFVALLRQKKIADVTTDFANHMTHELKTPLSAAGVIVKSLRTAEAKLDEEWYAELLGQLDNQHSKIRRLMDSVLTSAMDRPLGIPEFQTVCLATLLQGLKALAIDAGRELRLSGTTNISIQTDPDMLTGILANLLDNALKYTPSDTPLILECQLTEAKITFSLIDKGPGIAKPYQPHLFSKFYRVPHPDMDQVRGLGLGLYLCRLQAIQLDGKLSYQQNTAGGSIFSLILPYESDTAAFSRR